MAALVARREGMSELITIAENGQFAIHLPLSTARVGPFSTHTAHPEFLSTVQELLRSIFGDPALTITNPFLYLTKGEVVARLTKPFHESIPIAVSCWRASRLKTRHHCGICVPCIARRIALESQGHRFDEYERDIFGKDSKNLPHDDLGKRNLVELAEFVGHFSGALSKSDAELLENYPELFNEHLDRARAIAMYKRFAKESVSVMRKYKNAQWLLS
jgi:hypothetical protein